MTAGGAIMPSLPFTEINRHALASGYLKQLYPQAKTAGNELQCGDIQGGPGRSFCVNIETGAWTDNATGQKGRDIPSLVAAKDNIPQGEAARRVADDTGFTGHLPARRQSPAKRTPQVRPRAGKGKGSGEELPEAPTTGQPAHVYPYFNEDGSPAFEVQRFEAPGCRKAIRVKGSYSLDLLYRLDEVRESATVFIVEGESCVEALRTPVVGLVATTNPGGAGKWRDAHSKHLAGKKVFILPDNDDPGRTHAAKVAKSVQPLAASVKIVDLPGLPPKGDVVDWVAAGNDPLKIVELMDSAPLYEPPKDDGQAASGRGSCGEVGLHLQAARELIEAIGPDDIISDGQHFYQWTGSLWRRVDEQEIRQLIIRQEEANPKLSANAVTGIFQFIRSIVFRPGHSWNNPSQEIPVQNGVLCFEGGGFALRPHRREDYRTICLPVAYDPAATADRFRRFLSEVFEGDEGKITVALEAMGYTLLPTCRFERFLLLTGRGSNGKSVLLAVLAALVGNEHVCAVQPSQFNNRFQRAHLAGKLANIVTELSEGTEIADGEMKAFVSGEVITAEHKGKPPFELKPVCTHWLATNHLPHTRDFSDALFRRVIILTFDRIFTEDEQDNELVDKLKAELPGILNLALEALTGLLVRGKFTELDSNIEAKAEWRLEADQVAQFADEMCQRHPEVWETSKDLYAAYTSWAEESGIKRTLNRKNFSTRMVRLGAQLVKGTGGERRIAGFAIKGNYSGVRGF